MKYEEIRKNLEESSDEKYGLFHSKLVPGVSRIMGVRVPEVRKIAKKAAADWEEYLEEAEKKTASECSGIWTVSSPGSTAGQCATPA